MIYLDNAATTKVSNDAINTITFYCFDNYFNPSSTYHEAIELSQSIENVRKTISKMVGIDYNKNVIFTGSATEANNLAIKGIINKRSKQILISEGEHPSVYNVGKALLEDGFDVKFIKLAKNGEIDYDQLEILLAQKETSLISTMLVNNETGAINDLNRINQLKNKYSPNCLLHSDCVQAFGKIAINARKFGIDLMTISAHKIHGPKGIGALIYSPKIRIKAQINGGGQEFNLRSGTENVPYIEAFKTIIDETQLNQQKNLEKVKNLKSIFLETIKNTEHTINSSDVSSPYILSISFNGVRGETLVNMCYEKGLIISKGSACSSKKSGNRILESMGVSNIIGSVRVSFSSDNTEKEVCDAGQILSSCYKELFNNIH